ncbi:hypothetical protein FACS1894182_02020 [Bacteroidia bacterium]|nr:hypothetical protein FACS1894182_02020 [Bacteroidia bacterium]
MNIRIIFICVILLFTSSCKEDEPQKLVLYTPQQVDNTIVLNWEQADITGFKYYMVMRSSDKRLYSVINDIVTPASDAFRKEITTFEDHTYPLGVDTFYYKIMAIGDETASSQNLCYKIEHTVVFLTEDFRDLHSIEGSNKISMLFSDYSQGARLKVFDPKTGQFSSNEATVNLSYSCDWYCWSKYNQNTEFYNYNYNSGTVYVYDVLTSQLLTSLHIPNLCYAPFASNNKGLIYIYDYYLYLVNRETGTYTQYRPADYFNARNLYYNSKDNKLYAVDDYDNKMQIFNLDNQGSIEGGEVYTAPTGCYFGQHLYIENSSLFVVSTNSGVKILDMNTKTLHDTDFKQIPRLVLLHNNVLYVDSLYSGLIVVGETPKIHCFSAENFKLIKSIPVRVSPKKFVIDNEYLYFIGQYEYDAYILDYIKL